MKSIAPSPVAPKRVTRAELARVAGRFAALGSEPRVRIIRSLLAAHPQGLIAGDIQSELGIPGSTLSHHLEKLKSCGLVKVRREHQFLWYSANTRAVKSILEFLFAECCSRNRIIEAKELIQTCR